MRREPRLVGRRHTAPVRASLTRRSRSQRSRTRRSLSRHATIARGRRMRREPRHVRRSPTAPVRASRTTRSPTRRSPSRHATIARERRMRTEPRLARRNPTAPVRASRTRRSPTRRSLSTSGLSATGPTRRSRLPRVARRRVRAAASGMRMPGRAGQRERNLSAAGPAGIASPTRGPLNDAAAQHPSRKELARESRKPEPKRRPNPASASPSAWRASASPRAVTPRN